MDSNTNRNEWGNFSKDQGMVTDIASAVTRRLSKNPTFEEVMDELADYCAERGVIITDDQETDLIISICIQLDQNLWGHRNA
jgi:hypothetical protein